MNNAFEGKQQKAGQANSAIGTAYFYNMTNQDAVVTVNDFLSNPSTISAMPSSSPYTPNVSTPGFSRYDGPAQAGQFGVKNTVTCQLNNQPKPITVNIDVNFTPYPIQQDILIYLFYNSVVVAVASDNNAYLGYDKETITVDPENAKQKI